LATEFGLDLLNSAAQSRLSDAESAGRLREAELLGDGLEVAEVTEIHGRNARGCIQSHSRGEGKGEFSGKVVVTLGVTMWAVLGLGSGVFLRMKGSRLA
jgi:hypothetical protein